MRILFFFETVILSTATNAEGSCQEEFNSSSIRRYFFLYNRRACPEAAKKERNSFGDKLPRFIQKPKTSFFI